MEKMKFETTFCCWFALWTGRDYCVSKITCGSFTEFLRNNNLCFHSNSCFGKKSLIVTENLILCRYIRNFYLIWTQIKICKISCRNVSMFKYICKNELLAQIYTIASFCESTTTVDGKGGLSNNFSVIFPSFVHLLATKPIYS